MRKGYVDTSLGQVHYRTEGSGSPVVFLHQVGQSGSEFEGVARLLSHRYRVILPDILGYGFSDAAPDRVTIEDYARNVLEVLDGLGVERAAYVGHHGGAVVAIEIAASHPERVNRIALSGFTAPPDPAVAEQFVSSPMFNYKPIDDEGQALAEKWRMYRDWFRSGSEPEAWFTPFVSSLIPHRRLHDGHHAAFRYRTADRVREVRCPVLLIRPLRDQFAKDIEFTKSLLADCRVADIVDGGTFVPFEQPNDYASVLLSFLVEGRI